MKWGEGIEMVMCVQSEHKVKRVKILSALLRGWSGKWYLCICDLHLRAFEVT